ncbi:metallophosphoesterase family protein [Imtechella halotolerans]|uniref:Diadenosine 5',5'''-P1,P4-tetraphosphate asymmetrical hydrolase n=1 Tax=Imtechella halotolerans K1 TaxID=946077 RepID=I0WJP3_9FLAO|nr:metallophosphoesterase family protein [Imtechella halotolerans]EID76609.1 diadenosine 5',5'''-P1,P4-tetraphosphate asymmetrical hydrolase [Imtechella halotolerans K1]WMQ62821.1 metallophosphoesterase family protein [Imtechella halotolerans]
MRTLVIGDIHGAYLPLMQALDRARISPLDTLIFLGDYVDGWSQSPEVIEYLINLRSSYNCIFLRGNHDDLCLNWLNTQQHNSLWLKNGGQSTIEAYKRITQPTLQHHQSFLETLPSYHLDSENRLFVHAGFTNLNGVNFEYFPEMLYWDRTLWEMAMALNPRMSPKDPAYPKRLLIYNEIFIGHTPTTRMGITIPMNAANVWNIDTGAAYKGPVTVMNVETKEFWQSDDAYTFYPNENGRN